VLKFAKQSISFTILNISHTNYKYIIMDDEARQALATMKMPRRPINFVSAQSGEVLKLGHITCRIMEDGSRTGTATTEYAVQSIIDVYQTTV
jgi:hypothetical protein